MNKTLLILRHEFLHTVKRKGFIIFTLIVPILALLAIGIFQYVSETQKPQAVNEIKIGYVDEVGEFQRDTIQGSITLVHFDTQDAATKALIMGNITEYFVIPPDYVSSGVINLYSLQGQSATPIEPTMAAISNFLVSNLLPGKAPPAIVERIATPLNLVTTTLDKTGAMVPEQGGSPNEMNLIIPAAFGLLLALAMLFSSGYMLQGLGEEKENRIMEVLLSSVSTRQLLTGKVFGLGAAGLVQVAVWVVSLPLILNLASSAIGGQIGMLKIPANLFVLATVYFILGYLLFAVLAAGVGAISPTVQEGTQLSAIYSIFAIAPIWFLGLIVPYPNSPLSVFFTIFPLTAPVLVMARLGLTGIAPWELATSITVMVLSIVGGLLLASKVFRVYLLMYGKRPKLGEIIRSLKNE
jgi:ABC-2 type transport system permease protein